MVLHNSLTVSALIWVQMESLHILTIYTVLKLFSKNFGRSRKVTSLPTLLFRNQIFTPADTEGTPVHHSLTNKLFAHPTHTSPINMLM